MKLNTNIKMIYNLKSKVLEISTVTEAQRHRFINSILQIFSCIARKQIMAPHPL
jgi:hypothetical protein